jgi:hypothetical protein
MALAPPAASWRTCRGPRPRAAPGRPQRRARQPVEPEDADWARAHHEERDPIHLDRQALDAHATAAVDLPCKIPEQRALLRRVAPADGQLDQHAARRPQELGHLSGKLARFDLESKLHLAMALPTVDVLPEPTQVDRLAPDLGPLSIQLAGLDGVVGKGERVDQARLPGAVGPEDEGERAQRDPLGGAEGLEVGQAEGTDHLTSRSRKAESLRR